MNDETRRYFDYLRFVVGGLLAWGLGSVGVALLLARRARAPFQRHVAGQQAAWGGIDVALALLGGANSERNRARAQQGQWQGVVADEATRLWRILAVNALLDVGYLAGAAWLLRQRDEGRRGMGAGIVVQGGFLLLWDVANALFVRYRFLGRHDW